jgi:hypothetical protein
VLREILGQKMEEITGGMRKLHEEPHDMYSLTNITGVMKSRVMR